MGNVDERLLKAVQRSGCLEDGLKRLGFEIARVDKIPDESDHASRPNKVLEKIYHSNFLVSVSVGQPFKARMNYSSEDQKKTFDDCVFNALINYQVSHLGRTPPILEMAVKYVGFRVLGDDPVDPDILKDKDMDGWQKIVDTSLWKTKFEWPGDSNKSYLETDPTIILERLGRLDGALEKVPELEKLIYSYKG